MNKYRRGTKQPDISRDERVFISAFPDLFLWFVFRLAKPNIPTLASLSREIFFECEILCYIVYLHFHI